jgi:K+-sensing histidine kinase KdpD
MATVELSWLGESCCRSLLSRSEDWPPFTHCRAALHANDALSEDRGVKMRIVKGLTPIAASLGLMAAVTVLLWQVNLTAASPGLIYIYLFPVALIATIYNGRVAVLATAMALVCADYFLQEPIYSLANDNPREYGDLVCFTLLAVTAIKFIRVLLRPRATNLEPRTP